MRNQVYAGTRWLALTGAVCLLSAQLVADVVEDVRVALAQNSFGVAISELGKYRDAHGVDPTYLEAASWVARAYLFEKQCDEADHWQFRSTLPPASYWGIGSSMPSRIYRRPSVPPSRSKPSVWCSRAKAARLLRFSDATW